MTVAQSVSVLPEGFVLPPAPYLVVLLAGTAAVAAGFRRRPPTVTDRHVLALTPWMVVGASLHVLYQVDALPAVVRPLGGSPAVYVTVAVVAGATWLAVDAIDRPVPKAVGGLGVAAVVLVVGVALALAAARDSLSLAWPTVGLVASLVVGAVGWIALRRLVPSVEVAGAVGALAVFGHALDGVSTAVGVDVLGFGERTPLSRLVLETAAALPTAEVLGTGWLFVLLKLAVAGVVVSLLVDSVREDPAEGYALLGFVAAVGLGPGAHNLLLFAVSAAA